jgi:Tol biopolymer transport system component
LIETLSQLERPNVQIRLSPSGDRAALTRGADDQIFLMDLTRGITTAFTTGPERFTSPVWTPRGDSLLYSSTLTGESVVRVFRKSTDGSSRREEVAAMPLAMLMDGSADGKYLITASLEHSRTVLRATSLMGEAKTFDLATLPRPIRGQHARLSPDTRWLAFAGPMAGDRFQLYVQPFRPGETAESLPRWQLSSAGAYSPRWSSDGRELFYIERGSGGGRVMSVAVSVNGATPGFAAPVPLFTLPSDDAHFEPAPGGTRFLVISRPDNAAAETLTMLVNWEPRNVND